MEGKELKNKGSAEVSLFSESDQARELVAHGPDLHKHFETEETALFQIGRIIE